MTYLAKTAAVFGLALAASPALAQSDSLPGDDVSESTLTCGEFVDLDTAAQLEVARNVDYMGAADAMSDDELVETTDDDVQGLVEACDDREADLVNDVAGEI